HGPAPARVPPPAARGRLARPARRHAARQVRSNRHAITERTEPTAPPRPWNRAYRHFAHLPAATRCGDQHLGLQYEAAAAQRDLVEQRDRVRPVARLRVLELEPARPVDKEPGHADRIQAIGLERTPLG